MSRADFGRMVERHQRQEFRSEHGFGLSQARSARAALHASRMGVRAGNVTHGAYDKLYAQVKRGKLARRIAHERDVLGTVTVRPHVRGGHLVRGYTRTSR